MKREGKATSRKLDRELRVRGNALGIAIAYMQRTDLLADQLEEAFGPGLFNSKVPPLHRANVERFRKYVSMLQRLFMLHCAVFKFWMHANGIKPRHKLDWVTDGSGPEQRTACVAANGLKG